MSLTQTKDFYETDKAVSEYLFFHYGEPNQFLFDGIGPRDALDFPRRCGELDLGLDINRARALDLGCAVGRAACEFSARFDEVIAIDYAHALIEAAKRLDGDNAIELDVAEEGDLAKRVSITLPSNARKDRIEFQQGDAMNLPAELGQFDFILMANLIDRLPDPRSCLEKIDSFVAENGVVAITSPYTWLEEYTPRELWLGGYEREGQRIKTSDTLKEILLPKFSLLQERNMPFLIREHDRKNQFSIAHATLWQKR
ncbi:MAG: putative 4-mercaptohistidine N1-methyltransferase [Verrucomicrobiota bacterium]